MLVQLRVKKNLNFPIFPKKFKKPLIFSAWSSDKNIFEALKNGLSNAEGIDSDIDSSMFVE